MIFDFRDKYKGQTCLIIGNGPSLVHVPRSFIDRYLTYGQNKCYLNKPPLENFTPTFYVTSDPDHDIDYHTVLNMDCHKFLKEGLAVNGTRYVHSFRLTTTHTFSKHPDIVMYEGYSVTFLSLQLAYYFGFDTVLLVGVDHRYKYYQYGIEPDPNHYTPEYEGKTDFSLTSLTKGEKYIKESMEMAKEAFENDGRRVINLTQDSNLKVFQIDNINNWM